jgi:hypothetical protein
LIYNYKYYFHHIIVYGFCPSSGIRTGQRSWR